jgi:3D (Asp-Asp-Asp) domain-containing protein
MGFFLLSGGGAVATSESTSPPMPSITVSMTGYNAVPEQTDEDPFTTASGAYSNPEVVAARSVDLKEHLPFGTVIEIVSHNDAGNPNCGLGVVEEHIGYRVIADSMHPRKREQIDILLSSEKSIRAAGRIVNPAVALGVCKEVEIRVVGSVAIRDIPDTQEALREFIEETKLEGPVIAQK